MTPCHVSRGNPTSGLPRTSSKGINASSAPLSCCLRRQHVIERIEDQACSLIRKTLCGSRLIGVITDIDAITETRASEDGIFGSCDDAGLIWVSLSVASNDTTMFDYKRAVDNNITSSFEGSDNDGRIYPSKAGADHFQPTGSQSVGACSDDQRIVGMSKQKALRK